MKKIKSSAAIYSVIEEAMLPLEKPITCAELMDKADVRAAAVEKYGDDVQIATNKLSDLLGFMWRRGVLERYPADTSNTMARFAYLWKNTGVPTLKAIPNAKQLRVPAFTIDEGADGITLNFELFSIVIRPTKH